MKCDFCSDEPVVTVYLTPEHVIEEVPGIQRVSTGGWAACAACDTMIQADDPEAVIDRSVERLRRTDARWRSLPQAKCRSIVASMQQKFFALLAIGEAPRQRIEEQQK